MNTDEIKTAIEQTSFYTVESLRADMLLAEEIRKVADVETRRELTQKYQALKSYNVAVMARVPKRFPLYFDSSSSLGKYVTYSGLKSLQFLCQLPDFACLELYAAHAAHLGEPNVHLFVLRDVNDAKPQRERAKRAALAERDAERVTRWRKQIAESRRAGFTVADLESWCDELANEPEVAAALSRRNGEAKL